MKVIISNNITIKEPTAAVRLFCRMSLVIDNPDYLSRERMGKWTGTAPRYIHLYEEIGGDYILPYGCRKNPEFVDAIKGAQKIWADYKPEGDFKADYKSNIKLYPYQENAAKEALGAKNGIIVMPCGSGKTQTALEVVARLGYKTLWLTHTQDLLNQSMARARSCFDCDADMFGTITEGKINISSGITFATVQTMCKIDLSKYHKQWAVVVVDECQHCCGSPTRVTQFYKVVNSLYAPYKFGLTATPHRNDGLDKSMYALLGDTITTVPKEAVQTTCPVLVEQIDTEYMPEPANVTNFNGTINYSALITDLIENKQRFELISEIINTRCKNKSIVLANRVQYLKDLCGAYKGRGLCISAVGTSKKAKEERKEALKKLGAGEIDCIFATYQLAAEGLDCPELRYVVFATPEKNERTVTQAVGRVARQAPGKKYGKVLDFVDDFGMHKGWARKRLGYYRKLGAEVNILW